MFRLKDADSPEAKTDEYFQQNSRRAFRIKLAQLALISSKKEDFDKWIDDNLFRDPQRLIDYEQWWINNEYEKVAWKDRPFFIRYETVKPNTYQAQKIWFEEYWLPKVAKKEFSESHRFDKHLTHSDVWTLLKEAEFDGLISAQNVEYLNNFRLVINDLFRLLDKKNTRKLRHFIFDKDNKEWMVDVDNTAFWDLIDENLAQPESIGAKEWKQSLKESIKTELDFEDFQEIIWRGHVHHSLDFENMQKTAFKERSKWICSGKKRATNLRQMISASASKSVGYPITHLMQDIVHILNIWTDLNLAAEMYNNSVEKDGINHDYNKCFVWICLAVFGPVMIQYSSQMYMLYQKGMFTSHKFNKCGPVKRAYLTLQLSCFGVLFIIATDIFFKVKNFIHVLLLPFSNCSTKIRSIQQKISVFLQALIENAFDMTDYDVINYREQREYAQVIFEDSLMLIIYTLYFYKQLDVSNIHISDGPVLKSIVMTCISMGINDLHLKSQSKVLNESQLEYLLICLKAKYGWIPFGRKLEKNELTEDLHFGPLELANSDASNSTSTTCKYMTIYYRFTDQTLQLLNTHIATAALKKEKKIR